MHRELFPPHTVVSSECIFGAMLTSQFFFVDPPVDGVFDPSAAIERVSKLSLKNRHMYKRGLRKMDLHAQGVAAAQEVAATMTAKECMVALAKEHAECKALCTMVLVTAPWRYSPPPPSP